MSEQSRIIVYSLLASWIDSEGNNNCRVLGTYLDREKAECNRFDQLENFEANRLNKEVNIYIEANTLYE